MAGDQESKREVRITPPPRVTKVKPVVPFREASAESGSEHRNLRWVTIAAFILLLILAFGVFFYLPRWATAHRTPGTREEAAAEIRTKPPQEISSPPPLQTLREQAVLKQQADEVRERVERLRNALEAKTVSLWGGEAFRLALTFMAEGDAQQSDRDFAASTQSYQRSLNQLESLAAEATERMRRALAEGQKALSDGDAAAATRAFHLAAAIEPGNPTAATGLERAGVLNDVLALLASGREYERQGDLEQAVEVYRRAVSLDPLSRAAQRALARLDQRFTDEAFTRAMSEGVAALDDKDFQTAREAFERARAIKPDAPQVADGLAQADEGLRLEKIMEHREKAEVLEGKEEWRLAAEEYQSVLDMDPTIRFAQEGKARCVELADLMVRLEFHVSHPHRLSDASVRREASQLLDTVRSIEAAGPRLHRLIVSLEDWVDKASTPVRVHLISDDLTEVVVYRVGRLGRFANRELDLLPGTYTIVGTRRGYRDVRLELAVVAGEEPEPVVVRCEEKI